MTAGAVSAPLIIPIVQPQTHGAKSRVDTSTRVSIQSDTPDALILFTLDGSKPTPLQRGEAGRSRKYSTPILLPAGRVAVRAVAVTSDGRQSSTVTKVFSVELVDSNDRKLNGDNFLQSDRQRQTEGTFLSADASLRTPEQRMLGKASPQFGSPDKHQTGRSPSAGGSSTLASRIHRDIDFLRCPQCQSLCSDPFSRFCAQCGAEVPLSPEQRQDHVVCVCCGGANPARSSSCLSCESHLTQVCVGDGALSRKSSCSSCGRLNRGDSRYCDWCGSKRAHADSCVLCWRCGASGHPHAVYCAACGAFLEAPPLTTSSSDITAPVRGAAAANQAAANTSHDAARRATPSRGHAPGTTLATPTAEQHTQTVGLYFPSATELQRQRASQASSTQATRERQPLLTAISPGRGFWRKQLDHVCAHLRSYAQNHAPFRALLGEPRLGRVVSAVVQDHRSEVSVTVSFVSAGREEREVGPAGGGVRPAGRTETLSSVTERSAASSRRSDRSPGLMKTPKPDRTPEPDRTLKPPVRDVQLLKELGPGGGHISVLQQLLDQGADPSCCGSDGRHALAVAVVNGHHDALPVLVQRGADVDQQSGPMKNTALHEAAALGSEGLRSAQVLLSLKAGVRRRNAGGQTAYDVAVNSGCSGAVSLLAARTGLDLLGKLGKPKLSLDAF